MALSVAVRRRVLLALIALAALCAAAALVTAIWLAVLSAADYRLIGPMFLGFGTFAVLSTLLVNISRRARANGRS